MKACGLSQELRLITTQTRGLTDYGVKCGNPVVLFLEPKMLCYIHCETSNCRRMRRNCVSPHALKDYSLTYHTDGHGVRTILTIYSLIQPYWALSFRMASGIAARAVRRSSAGMASGWIAVGLKGEFPTLGAPFGESL